MHHIIHGDALMRETDNAPILRVTATHPYLAVIRMDPADWGKFQRLSEDRPEVELLGIDRSKPDVWTVRAACASRTVADLLERNW